jgi:hypothetical protein
VTLGDDNDDEAVDAALDFPTVDRFLDAQRRLLDDEFDPTLVADLDPDDGLTPDAGIEAAMDPDWEPD